MQLILLTIHFFFSFCNVFGDIFADFWIIPFVPFKTIDSWNCLIGFAIFLTIIVFFISFPFNLWLILNDWFKKRKKRKLNILTEN